MTQTYDMDSIFLSPPSQPFVLAAGLNLTTGAALGQITATGQLTQLNPEATDGSQVPFATLSAALDTSITGTDAPAPCNVQFTLAAGQVLFRGATLGRITSTGQLAQLYSGATDGSQVPFAILAETRVDTSATGTNSPATCNVWLSGTFNGRVLGFHGSDDWKSYRRAFSAIGITLTAPWQFCGGIDNY